MGRRNVQGGNKTKAMARSSGRTVDREVRTVSSTEEEYAIITAVHGNGRFRVLTEAKKNYVGVLPGSMRGNKKRNNYVEFNSIVLINNRMSWQTVKDMCPADIVHVYSPNHIQELKLHEKFQDQLLEHFNKGSQMDKSLVVFDHNASMDMYTNEVPIQDSRKMEMPKENNDEEEDFDIDLI
jgi:hypothetical protein